MNVSAVVLKYNAGEGNVPGIDPDTYACNDEAPCGYTMLVPHPIGPYQPVNIGSVFGQHCTPGIPLLYMVSQ